MESLVTTIEFMSSLQAVRIIPSPIGQIAIGATDVGICDVEIMVPERSRSEFFESAQSRKHADVAASQLREYFDSARTVFDLEFDIAGTDFQEAVWKEIADLGFGASLGYGEIANRIGKPEASRAVGGAVGANPVPLLIGCHRVLGSNKKLTGYSGGQGLKTKLWLLEHEQIEYR